jgi:serine/threonine-protein kinase
MAQAVPDEALARHLHQVGAATLEQLERAKQIQANAARKGKDVPLSRVLILMGVLTPTLLENLEKTLRGQQEGGLGQIAHYKLLRKLGEGGMGAVYLAEDLNAGREVALKILSPELAGDAQFLSRFKREAIATGKLNHVNIVAAYTFDREGEYCYYAMEYCDGEALGKYLERAQVLPEEEALKIIGARRISLGTTSLHSHHCISVVHWLMDNPGARSPPAPSGL